MHQASTAQLREYFREEVSGYALQLGEIANRCLPRPVWRPNQVDQTVESILDAGGNKAHLAFLMQRIAGSICTRVLAGKRGFMRGMRPRQCSGPRMARSSLPKPQRQQSPPRQYRTPH